MSNKYLIQHTVQFPEQTTVPKGQSHTPQYKSMQQQQERKRPK
jgi:hypothetical protein